MESQDYIELKSVKYNLPEEVSRQVENQRFVQNSWKCQNGEVEVSDTRYVRRVRLTISEDKPLTHIHPESFDFSDVYGECEIAQMMLLIDNKKEAVITPMVITEFEHQKNVRTFDEESAPPKELNTRTGFAEPILIRRTPEDVLPAGFWMKNSEGENEDPAS